MSTVMRRLFSLIAILGLAAGAGNAQDHPFLGIQMDSAHEGDGVKVDQVIAGTAAEKVGLAAGDVLVEFDGERIVQFERLVESIRERGAGSGVVVGIEREGKRLYRLAVLGARDRPDLPPPLADPLAGAFERLGWKAENAYAAGEHERVAELGSACEQAAELYVALAAETLPEGDRPAFESRVHALCDRTAWFVRQSRRGAKAPSCHLDPPTGAGSEARARAVAELVVRLDDPDFTVRESATRELVALGQAIRDDLVAAEGEASLEARHRIEKILEEFAGPPDADRPPRRTLPVEAEVVEFADGRGCLDEVYGRLAGPRLVEAELIRDGRPAGRVALDLGEDGRFELAAGSKAVPGEGDFLVWIDVLRESE